jgi:nicotinamide phosphoribosyltransferase
MKILAENPLLDTDSYKFSHYLQYPPGTEKIVDYLESRGGRFPYTVFFGLRYILERYLSQRITPEMVEEAKALAAGHGVPFNYDGWMFIAKNLKGKLPIRIDAVSEGSVVPVHNLLMRVESTNAKVPWITGWVEAMLQRVWYPTTVATQSHNIKNFIGWFLEQTGDVADLPFKLHDFGNRGVSSLESAMIGGAAHLVNFMGTDTIPALRFLAHYYDEPMAGFSIPAAEHSTITSWGREHEVDAYRNMLTQFAKPGAVVAVVSDSYDLWNAIDKMWGSELRQQVINSGATLVIRPDSGDPKTVVLKALNRLRWRFGATRNAKGYDVLNHVRVIQGDGVNAFSISEILSLVTRWGFSADNIGFGMGGALLQKLDRDTQKFAIKCCAIQQNGALLPVFKDPVTDPGKKSKSGYLDLRYNPETGYETVVGRHWESALYRAFENGEVDESYRKNNTLSDIRRRADKG